MLPPWLSFLWQPLGVTLAALARKGGADRPGEPPLHLHYPLQAPGSPTSSSGCYVVSTTRFFGPGFKSRLSHCDTLTLMCSSVKWGTEATSVKCLPSPRLAPVRYFSKCLYGAPTIPTSLPSPAFAPVVLLLSVLPVQVQVQSWGQGQGLGCVTPDRSLPPSEPQCPTLKQPPHSG